MKKIQIAKKKFKRLIKFGLPKKLENFVKIFSTLFIKLAAVNVNRKRWDPPVALGGRFGRKQPHFESTREPNHWLTLSAFCGAKIGGGGIPPSGPVRTQAYSLLLPPASHTMACSPSFTSFGGGGIRTHETLSCLHAFQACSIGHSDTPPEKTIGRTANGLKL